MPYNYYLALTLGRADTTPSRHTRWQACSGAQSAPCPSQGVARTGRATGPFWRESESRDSRTSGFATARYRRSAFKLPGPSWSGVDRPCVCMCVCVYVCVRVLQVLRCRQDVGSISQRVLPPSHSVHPSVTRGVGTVQPVTVQVRRRRASERVSAPVAAEGEMKMLEQHHQRESRDCSCVCGRAV